MAAFQQAAKRRRLSLSMMVMLLLHWSFSSCAALADTLCVEPDGVVVWEQSGDPCHSALAEHASDTPCVAFQAQDGHDDVSPAAGTHDRDGGLAGLCADGARHGHRR